MVKWLARLASSPVSKAASGAAEKKVSKYGRTPVPPKPYKDRFNSNIVLKEDGHQETLANMDPEKPHWRDPKFESRKATPIVDIFGFNRNWSMSLAKVMAFLAMCGIIYQEINLMSTYGDDGMRMNGGYRSAVPGYARDDMATERELREAGFSYVGVRGVDNVGTEKSRADAQRV
uniref:Uncharacterized protein n=1 Tax=Neobodo designis TaxID=312471 RepID=A0A7S1LXE7_NEODS